MRLDLGVSWAAAEQQHKVQCIQVVECEHNIAHVCTRITAIIKTNGTFPLLALEGNTAELSMLCVGSNVRGLLE